MNTRQLKVVTVALFVLAQPVLIAASPLELGVYPLTGDARNLMVSSDVAIAWFHFGDFMSEHADGLLKVNGYNSCLVALGDLAELRVPASEASAAQSLLKRDGELRNYSLVIEDKQARGGRLRTGWSRWPFLLPYRIAAAAYMSPGPPNLHRVLEDPVLVTASEKYPFVVQIDFKSQAYLEWHSTMGFVPQYGARSRVGYEIDVKFATSVEASAPFMIYGFQLHSSGRLLSRAAWRDRAGNEAAGRKGQRGHNKSAYVARARRGPGAIEPARTERLSVARGQATAPICPLQSDFARSTVIRTPSLKGIPSGTSDPSVTIAGFSIFDPAGFHAETLLRANAYSVSVETHLGSRLISVPQNSVASAKRLIRRDARMRGYTFTDKPKLHVRSPLEQGWERTPLLLPYLTAIDAASSSDALNLHRLLEHRDLAAASEDLPFVVHVDSHKRDYLESYITGGEDSRMTFAFTSVYDVEVLLARSADPTSPRRVYAFTVSDDGTSVNRAHWRDR